MPKIDPRFEKAKENFIKQGGDIHNVPAVFDEYGNIYVTFDGIDFVLTEDGDIIAE